MATEAEQKVEEKTISEMVTWLQAANGESRLLLPPIQRSVVWSNEQIINYWDSLLRGYPAGLMMVHRVARGENAVSSKGRDINGTTGDATKIDYQLFDGQQRMAAILIGLGKGLARETRRLWVDLGIPQTKNSGLKFQMRMTSTGQPFGYKADAPNQKIDLGRRQDKWADWRTTHGDNARPQDAFKEVTGNEIIGASCAVPFEEACSNLGSLGRAKTIAALRDRQGASPELIEEFVAALEKALGLKVVLQQVNTDIVANQEEYVRFFGRLGQGGTRLSDDELVYSILKCQYEELYGEMKNIMGKAGRLAGEVDLVMAALRVSKTLAPWPTATEWERISRPSPSLVFQMKDKQDVQAKFREMILQSNPPPLLQSALVQVVEVVSYDKVAHPKGLPAMLLARMPRELIDVLVLFMVARGASQPWADDDCETLRAFVLYWLLFVGDDGKAAWRAFQLVEDKNQPWVFAKESVRNLILECEKAGHARVMPRRNMLPALRDEIVNGGYTLRAWDERFMVNDESGSRKPDIALRELAANGELIKRALLWLQRGYLTEKFPNYDPTSDRDDDLPVDLDHLVPNDIFGFDWRQRNPRLKEAIREGAIAENFRGQRGVVGNSLGNFRWLAASDNRSRGERALVPDGEGRDFISNTEDWNKIIPRDKNQQPWSTDDIATFQRLIDLRTLELYERLLTESGIESILPTALPG